MNTSTIQEPISYRNSFLSQAKSKKPFISGKKAYYYNTKAYKEELFKRERVLSVAVRHNLLQPILIALSGIRNKLRLKTMKLLITFASSGHVRISYHRIRKAVGCTRRQAIRNIRYLSDNGFLTTLQESHTSKNGLSNMYILSTMFKDKTLLSRLNDMYYSSFRDDARTKELNCIRNKADNFHVTPIKNNNEVLNYNSISTHNFGTKYKYNKSSTNSIGNILNNIMFLYGKDNACCVGTRPKDSFKLRSCQQPALYVKKPKRERDLMKLKKEEKERIRKFITKDLRPSYLLFRDKNNDPDKYALEEEASCEEKKPRKFIANYFEQFREGFVD